MRRDHALRRVASDGRTVLGRQYAGADGSAGRAPGRDLAEFGQRDGAVEPGSPGRRLDDLERVNTSLGGDVVDSAPGARGQEAVELEAQRLVAARRQLLLASVYGLPHLA